MRVSKASLAVLAAAIAAPALGGEIKGTVRYAGPAPRAARLEVTKDRATCGDDALDESLVARAGKLEYVVVTVNGATVRGDPGKVTIDQRRCRFVPHVQAAAVGSSIDVVNSDPVLHNVHAYLGTTTVINLAMPLEHQRLTPPRRLDRPGLVRIECDVHSWMTAYIVVTDEPHGVSGPDGTFDIPNVPPGSYTLTAWHEKLGKKTTRVTVPATGAATADFTFGG